MLGQGCRRLFGFLALVFLAHVAESAVRGQESWDAIYVAGTKVGFTHLTVEPVKDRRGRELRRVKFETEMTFQRDRDRVRLSLLYGTIETPSGEVLRLDTRTDAGSMIRAAGDVIDGVMKLRLEAGNQTQTLDIPWGSEVRGPYGAELSLSHVPLPPGETREIKTFIPDLNRVCVTRLEAKALEEVKLGQEGKSVPLLRIEQTVLDANGKSIAEMASTLWVDRTGQILKSHTDLLGGVDIYRTTKQAALADNGAFNLLANSIIRTKPIPNAQNSRHIVYRVRVKGDDPRAAFTEDARQKMESVDAGAGTLTVRTVGREEGQPGPSEVDPAYLSANPLVDSADARVQSHVKRALERVGDEPWAKVEAIEKWVFQNLRRKNFQIAFAPAARVAQELQGDCTEHSVLFAAMARAAGIPTRCVVGVVYVADQGGFGPHMWNEVYVNGRWTAVDATFDQTEVDAAHLKFSDSSLDGVAAFEALLPVLRVFNKLEIEPIEIR